MPTYPFLQVDAFTVSPLSGNPCAVLFDTDDLDDSAMLSIAREMNLAETAFVRNSVVADFGVRYFTPAEEIPLAGHPTIATAFALVETKRLSLTGDYTIFTLELRVGPIRVEIYASQGIVNRVVMTQKKPEFLATYKPLDVMHIFGLSSDDVLPDLPVQTVSTGTPQLMVPLRDLEALRRAQLDVGGYNDFRARSDFFSPHLFCVHALSDGGRTFARHFSMPPDLSEDPFTGSATGGMAAYLWRYGLIKQPKFVAEQGHWMRRPGRATVEIVGPPDDIETVKVGGPAVTVIRGELEL